MRVTRGVSGFRGRLVLTACLLLGAEGSAGAQLPLPPPTDRVVHDFAGVLSAQAVQTMERFHKELFDQTQVAIVVVTIPNLEGEPIRDFSVRLGTEWGVGKQDVDRGIVVALAVEERRHRHRDRVRRRRIPAGRPGRRDPGRRRPAFRGG